MKIVSDIAVPHLGPEYADILILADCPTSDDTTCLRPFSGKNGELLDVALDAVGISRDDCRLGYVLNYQPAKDEHKRAFGTRQMEESRSYLSSFLQGTRADNSPRHRIILAAGDLALNFLTGFDSIDKHRGSVYNYKGMHVIPITPLHICRWDGAKAKVLLLDLLKAKRVLEHGFKEPDFNFIIDPDIYQLEGVLNVIRNSPLVSADIETKRDTNYIRCIQFAWSSLDAVCIYNDAPYIEGTTSIGPTFRRVVGEVLESSSIEKVFHNGMFDTILLESNGFVVNNYQYDTMYAQHVLQPQLPLGLDFLTSIYTNINYYKDDGKGTSDRIDRQKLGIYGCKDVVATWQSRERQLVEFAEAPQKWKYFQYKMKQLALAKHFSTTGMLVDSVRQTALRERVTAQRESDYMIFFAILKMFGVEYFTVSQSGKVKDFLYKTLELPPKKNSDGNLTADEDAIVDLITTVTKKIQDLKTEKAQEPWKMKLTALKLILSIRGYDKLMGSYIDITTSTDGRARSWYKFWGTETGRWSAAKWYDDTGLNGQTIPRESL
jgi:uracil-DNA glycosylase family 4